MEIPLKEWDEKWPKQAMFMPFRQENNTFVKNWQDKEV